MTRIKFEVQLAQLNIMLIQMGALIETAIKTSVEALQNQDVDLARKTVLLDHDIDHMEKDIESLCMRLLLQQQPVARDLRLISSALKMSSDMERIGDHAEDIAELTIAMADAPYVKELVHIPQMAEASIRMVTDSIDAFVKNDLTLAQSVIDRDDVVDDLFRKIKEDLINLIHQDSGIGSRAMDLYMVAKYFERIGDHAVCVANWVIYSITGVHKPRRHGGESG
ncbi:MAG: phosphate signaling complex protein PhoU [Desulfovibrio sp.]|jgi:phosphate transport system protein|nr:phosphate signaling complex protein PhoU [Desulfovibrio sp.]